MEDTQQLKSTWLEISKEDFYASIGRLDVHPSLQPGGYPYTALWLTPTREVRGKSVEHVIAGIHGTRYFLPNKEKENERGSY